MLDELAAAFGRLDVLVNNAGVIEASLSSETAIDELREEVRAAWLTIKFAAPFLRRSRRGPSIVNAASVSG